MTTIEPEVRYCTNHPNVETLLRCNKCERPICIKCAVQTPVGYRCKDCVRAQQGVYFNAQGWDNPIAFAVGLLVTLVATPIASAILGFGGFLGIIVALAIGASAGGILAQAIRWAVNRRRGRYLGYFAVAGILFGVILGSMVSLLLTGRFPLFSPPTLILAFLAITTAYQILRS
jgi:MFS family permease